MSIESTTQSETVEIGVNDGVHEYYGSPNKMDSLFNRIQEADTVEDWSQILSDYLSWGNRKVSDTTAIFNMNSAHDCPNRETQEEGESETGLCQVPWDYCYAGQTEKMYGQSLDYRKRQEYLWDCLDPETFAKAFVKVVERKIRYGNIEDISDVDLRLSEAGDFRHNGDIYKANRIAEILHEEGVGAVYTYSASFKLDGWFKDDVNNLILMQSVGRDRAGEYGDKEYNAFTLTEEDIEEADTLIEAAPEDTVWCPHDLEKRQNDVTSEEAIQCGDCRLCLEKEGPDVGIPLHK